MVLRCFLLDAQGEPVAYTDYAIELDFKPYLVVFPLDKDGQKEARLDEDSDLYKELTTKYKEQMRAMDN